MSKTQNKIDASRVKNQTLKLIAEVIGTVSSVDLLYKDTLYKEGFKDCLELFKVGLRRIK